MEITTFFKPASCLVVGISANMRILTHFPKLKYAQTASEILSSSTLSGYYIFLVKLLAQVISPCLYENTLSIDFSMSY
jgi:hypothetical protein